MITKLSILDPQIQNSLMKTGSYVRSLYMKKWKKDFLKENRQSFIIGQLMMGSLSVNSSSEFTQNVMTDIGSVGYAVRIAELGKGYGTEILRQGLEIAKCHGMEKVLLIISEENAASIHIC